MDRGEFRGWAHRAADWSADYLDGVAGRPVRAQVRPGDLAARIADSPPEAPEDLEAIFEDFQQLVPDGLTHWQHPRFFAYFPANAAPASMIADQLATAMAAQCMLWQTAPIATEMETVMVDWLRQAFGISDGFRGTLQDSATTATTCAVMTMRERALAWQGNEEGLAGGPRLRIYASSQNHSSIDKAVRLAGIGQSNLVKIPTRADHGLDPAALQKAIAEDRKAGFRPAGIVACTGGTGIGAMDPIAEIAEVAEAEELFLHVDAAWAGAAMICPEYRHLWAGIDRADSLVVNPHKWLGAQFECSLHLVKDPAALVRTVGLRPGYLQTLGEDEVTNYNEWSIALGRRFRALKVWFLLRSEGLEGLRTRIRNHVLWTEQAATRLAADPNIEIITAPSLSLFTFAHMAGDTTTERLIQELNDDGRIYLTQTMHDGQFVIRMSVGQWDTSTEDVDMACNLISEFAARIGGNRD